MKRDFLLWISTDDPATLSRYASDTRNYDIAVHDYGTNGIWWKLGMSEYYFRAKGEKLKTAAGFLPGLPGHYKRIAIWDDDIGCVPDTLNRLFAVGEALRLPLYQPALTLNSYCSHNHLFQSMSMKTFPVRRVPFVEIMVPIFSMPALLSCLPLFDMNESGWGLDLWDWPKQVEGETYVIDTLPVAHMREPARRERVMANGLTPMQELWIAEKTIGPNRGSLNPPTKG